MSFVWEPTRAAASSRLEAFGPSMGETYAERRNYDLGPEARGNVSLLSPWVRVRALSERELVATALAHHGPAAADKFIQEVCWRSYWKGWLQLRPSVWGDYRRRLAEDRARVAGSPRYRRALEGRTPIESFNTWLGELVEHNYLNNHARMWFASIWCFTLELPWTLGADLFMRHLLDGDAASNTLSWRWVAGLHTQGKTYAARASNIQRFTEARLGHGEQFATPRGPVHAEQPPPRPRTLDILRAPALRGRVGLLLTDEDLTPRQWGIELERFVAGAALLPARAYARDELSAPVVAFRRGCVVDGLERLRSSIATVELEPHVDVEAALHWARAHALETVVLAEPSVGVWNATWRELSAGLRREGIELVQVRRAWDECFWPLATKGFFQLRKRIPTLLAQLDLGSRARARAAEGPLTE